MVRGLVRLPIARDPEAPKTRGECPDIRPCPWVSCRMHLLVDAMHVGAHGQVHASLKKARPFDEDDEASIAAALTAMADTCALDVADRGALSQSQVGELIGLTHQRVDQIEFIAVAKMRAAHHELEDDMLKHKGYGRRK